MESLFRECNHSIYPSNMKLNWILKLGEYWTLWGKREQAACILATEERVIYL